MFLLLFVSRDVAQAEEMLDVWVKAGVPGVTIIESAGMMQAAERGLRDDLGLVFSLSRLMQSDEVPHRTLFSAIPDEATLNRALAASHAFIGDWSQSDVGILLVLPILQAFGLNTRH